MTKLKIKDLPSWLLELWHLDPSLARRAEKDYLALARSTETTEVPEKSWAYYEEQLKKLDQLNQSQRDLSWQLQILRPFANKLGLYDAADFIKTP